jgi:hypothetical protein
MPYKDPAKNRARNRAYRMAHPEQGRAYRNAHSEKNKAYQAAYYQANKDKMRAQNKIWREANKEELKDASAAYYAAHTEEIKVKVRIYEKARIQVDEAFRLTKNLRHRVRQAIKGFTKSARTLELFGCTPEELKKHLESQFKPDMTWENYGYRGWHIDHIRPCADFDLSDPEQQRQCFHYTNLQPLWAEENLRKSNKGV